MLRTISIRKNSNISSKLCNINKTAYIKSTKFVVAKISEMCYNIVNILKTFIDFLFSSPLCGREKVRISLNTVRVPETVMHREPRGAESAEIAFGEVRPNSRRGENGVVPSIRARFPR